MALPSLDPSSISFIGYWNFNDNSSDTITPTEATSAMASYEEYSNGVDGTILMNFGGKADRVFKCRVKDDGWIICWIDREENTGTGVADSDTLVGTYDILRDWTEWNGTIYLTENNVRYGVNLLFNALSNSGTATFNYTDVGTYNFMHSNATTMTSAAVNAGYGDGFNFDVTIESTTTLHAAYVTASLENETILLDGQEIAGGSTGGNFAARNYTSALSAGDTFTLSTSGTSEDQTGFAMVLWS